MGSYQPQELGQSVYGSAQASAPPRPAGAQAVRPEPYGMDSAPDPGAFQPPSPPEQAPAVGPTYQPPVYQPGKVDQVPGPKLQYDGAKESGDASKLLDNISKQQFPGSEGGPTRIGNPSKPTMPMKSSTFSGGGWNGGGPQTPQWEGQAGRLAQYAQYVSKNPYRRE